MIKRILAIKLRPLGDTVLMTAPLLELRHRYPNARIDVLVLKDWAALFDSHPGCDRVFLFERRTEKTARARTIARMGLQLRREKYDLVVNFHASPSSSLLALSTGASTRAIHFHSSSDRNRYSTVNIPDKGVLKPNIERDMDALRALGISIPVGKLPRLYLRNLEKLEAETFLRTHWLQKPLLGLALGASRPTKKWPMDSYVAIARMWKEQKNGSVVLIASAEERTEVQAFQNEARVQGIDVHAAVGLPLRQLLGLIGELAVLVGNDSGPRHLAVALDRPTVTLIGPENPIEWHPYPLEQHPSLYLSGLTCRRSASNLEWCGLYECTVEGHRCMTEIGIDSVFSQIQRVTT